MSRWDLHLKKHFRHLPAAVLSTEHQRTYRPEREKEGATLATVNRELQCIRRSHRLALDHEPQPKVSRVPRFLILHEDKARKEFFTLEEYHRIQTAASSHSLWMRVLVDLAYNWGWRRNELLGLHLSCQRGG